MQREIIDRSEHSWPIGLTLIFISCIAFFLSGIEWILWIFSKSKWPGHGIPSYELKQQVEIVRHTLFAAYSICCTLGIWRRKSWTRLLLVIMPTFYYACTYFVYKTIDIDGLGLGLLYGVVLALYLYGFNSVKTYFSVQKSSTLEHGAV